MTFQEYIQGNHVSHKWQFYLFICWKGMNGKDLPEQAWNVAHREFWDGPPASERDEVRLQGVPW